MQLADCGHHVWVGDHRSCDASGARFDRRVHIWHSYQQGKNRCRHIDEDRIGADDLVVRYRDGDPLATLGEALPELIAFVGRPGQLLVHCAFGCYRGPTLAVLAKVVRGGDPFDSLAEVARGMWTWYGTRQVPYLNSIPIREVIELRAAGNFNSIIS